MMSITGVPNSLIARTAFCPSSIGPVYAHAIAHALWPSGPVRIAAAAVEIRRGLEQRTVEPQDFAGGREGVDHHAPDDRAQGMQPVFESGHHAEVPAAAPERPEQIGVLVGADTDLAAVGEHDVGREQVVRGHAEGSLEPSKATTERETGNSSVADGPARRRKAVSLRRCVEFGPPHSGLRAGDARDGVHVNGLHQREVDDDAAVARAHAGDTVGAAANRERQLVTAVPR